MKTLRIYEYENCDTCRKALKFLQQKGIAVERIDITQHPPSRAELERMLEHLGGNIRKLFNTAGKVYREMKLSEKLPALSPPAALDLLAKNGRLVKRPFVLLENTGFVGFQPKDWEKALAR